MLLLAVIVRLTSITILPRGYISKSYLVLTNSIVYRQRSLHKDLHGDKCAWRKPSATDPNQQYRLSFRKFSSTFCPARCCHYSFGLHLSACDTCDVTVPNRTNSARPGPSSTGLTDTSPTSTACARVCNVRWIHAAADSPISSTIYQQRCPTQAVIQKVSGEGGAMGRRHEAQRSVTTSPRFER